MPTMGHRLHEHPQLSMRETHEGNYRIIYTFMNEEMQVITIVHMKQVLRRRRLK
jgi:mRNA-degrading endonuclease RelE of RelBE toxin-antitoxin system